MDDSSDEGLAADAYASSGAEEDLGGPAEADLDAADGDHDMAAADDEARAAEDGGEEDGGEGDVKMEDAKEEDKEVKDKKNGAAVAVEEEEEEEEDLEDGEGEEDPVEHSFDLYLSREMEEELYMLRYPLRAVTREPPRLSSARFKPKNQVLETTVDVLDAFPGDDPNGNASFELPPHAEHLTDEERREYLEKVRKQNFRSVRLNTHERCYAAAVIDKASNSVTLVPLQGIYDMMPVIQTGFESQDGPIDDEEFPAHTKRSKSAAAAVAQPVALQREATYDPNRQRFAKVKQQLNEEAWIELDVHERDSAQASSAFASLRYKSGRAGAPDDWVEDVSGDDAQSKAGKGGARADAKGCIPAGEALQLGTKGYLDILAPKIRRAPEESDADALPGDKPQTIEDHVRAQLIKQGVVTTEMMEGSLTRAFGNLDAKIMRALPETLGVFAHLVHGAWYLRSEIYNEHRFGIAQSGDDIADHQRNWTRNAILAIFAEQAKGQVSRAAISKEVKGVLASSMLESVAVYNGEKKLWELFRVDEKYHSRNAALAAKHRAELRSLHCDALQRLVGWSEERAYKAAFPGEARAAPRGGFKKEPVPPRATQSPGATSKPKVKFEK